MKFLNELGNPYDELARDEFGKHSVNFGIYGIPESILINKDVGTDFHFDKNNNGFSYCIGIGILASLYLPCLAHHHSLAFGGCLLNP